MIKMHLSSNLNWARHDMGLRSQWKHTSYQAHCGEFDLIDLLDLTEEQLVLHPEFQMAMGKNLMRGET